MVLGHLDGARYLSGIFYIFSSSILVCADSQSFSAFFFLHTDMIFKYPRDNSICDLLLTSNKHLQFCCCFLSNAFIMIVYVCMYECGYIYIY